MTQEEHNLLVENNIMLKEILRYIKSRDNPIKAFSSTESDIKDFIMNVVANVVSNNTL